MTSTQTVSGLNGFTGTVSLGTPGAAYYVSGSNYVEFSNGASGALTLRYTSPTSFTLSPTANTATLTGRITINSTPPASNTSYYFTYTATGTPTYGAGNNYPTTNLTLGVTATVGTIPMFNISGVPPLTTVFANGSTGPTTPITVVVNPVNGSTPSPITFAYSNNGFYADTVVNEPSSTPAGSPWPATFYLTVPTNATPGPQTLAINASGGGITVPFQLPVNVQPGFTLTASPTSQTAGPGGTAGYQLSLGGGNNFTGQVSLSVAGLPPGASASFGPATVQSPGSSSLLITVPSVLTQTTYTLTVTGTSGSLTTSSTITLLANPPSNTSPATMAWPVNGSTIPVSLANAAPFTWTSGVGVSQYQLSVGSSPGASDIYATHTFPAGTKTATVPGLPTLGQTVYVSLQSMIKGQAIADPSGPQECHGGGGSDDTPPTVGRTPGTAYVLNASQYGQPPNGETYYTYTLDQGDASYLLSCFPSNPNDPLVVEITNIVLPTLSGGETHQFQVGYTAMDNVTPGNHGVNCWWQGPDSDGETDTFPLVDSNGNGVVVYDATPVITSTNDPSIWAGDSTYTTQLVITGHNFGQSGQLVFCSALNSGCTSSDPQH